MFFTVAERTDGFGAQFQTMICCILIAEHYGNYYIHTPIKLMEHNYNNDPTFIEKVENYMNLKNNYNCLNNETNKYNIKIINAIDIINKFESNINVYLHSQSLQKLKRCFWDNKNKYFFNNNKINVGVHIRVPNIHDYNNFEVELRLTPINYYFNIINQIKQKYFDKELLFHIYSQNDISDYDKFDKTNIEFHLNENVFDTFTGLAAANILIMSKSSFSYSAAIISDGEIYYQPFWHIPGPNWIVCQ